MNSTPIASHRKKLGDREKHTQFVKSKKEASVRGSSRRTRASVGSGGYSDSELSSTSLALLIIGFLAVCGASLYWIVHIATPPA